MSDAFSNQFESLDFGETIRGLRAGEKLLRRYTLKRILGRGGMGVVWLAQDEALDREIAVKLLPEAVSHDKSALEDLKRETKRSLELNHPNIIHVYDFVSDETCAGITMEFVDGATLSNLRGEQPNLFFEVEDIKPWVHQLCQALEYAHEEAQLAHRDLKPANLMITKGGRLKVTDFGISGSVSTTMARITRGNQGGLSGTLAYMSPEQAMGESPSIHDDIYAVGATIYEMLTSKPPFYQGDTTTQLREKIPPKMVERRKELKLLREGVQRIPKVWEDVIADCLQKQRSKRPQSARELRDRLGLQGTTVMRPVRRPAGERKASSTSLDQAKTEEVRKSRPSKGETTEEQTKAAPPGEASVRGKRLSRSEGLKTKVPLPKKGDTRRSSPPADPPTETEPPAPTPSGVEKPKPGQALPYNLVDVPVPGAPPASAPPQTKPTAKSPGTPAPPPDDPIPATRPGKGGPPQSPPSARSAPAKSDPPGRKPIPDEPREDPRRRPDSEKSGVSKWRTGFEIALILALVASTFWIWYSQTHPPTPTGVVIPNPVTTTNNGVNPEQAAKIKKQEEEAQAAKKATAEAQKEKARLEQQLREQKDTGAQEIAKLKKLLESERQSSTTAATDESKKKQKEIEDRIKQVTGEQEKKQNELKLALADATAASEAAAKREGDLRNNIAVLELALNNERRKATLRGGVIIEPKPRDAQVVFNTQVFRGDRVLIPDLLQGGYQVQVKLEGYETTNVPVTVRILEVKGIFSASTNPYPVTLKKNKAYLVVRTEPEVGAACNVTLTNGAILPGKTPFTNFLGFGPYKVEINKDGFLPEIRTAEVKDDPTKDGFAENELRVKLSSSQGMLVVRTSPSGAAYTINLPGGAIYGKTPLATNIPFGTYPMRFDLQGYESKTTNIPFTGDSKQNSEFTIPLQRNMGFLVIRTEPEAGALCNLTLTNGTILPGHTPFTNFLGFGTYKVQISKEGFQTETHEVVVKDDPARDQFSLTNLVVKLRSSSGGLSLKTSPGPATYTLNLPTGVVTGQTPLITNLPFGTYPVRFDLKGFASVSTNIVISENSKESRDYTFRLQRNQAYVVLSSTPDASDFKVMLGGRSIETGTTPATLLLPLGKYDVRFEHDGCDPATLPIEVVDNPADPTFSTNRPASVTLRVNRGNLVLVTRPPGANCKISLQDGTSFSGFTPITKELPVGNYTVQFDLEGYDTEVIQTFIGLKPGEKANVTANRTIEMVRSTGTLALRTLPAENVRYQIVAANKADKADTNGIVEPGINRITLPTGSYKVKLSCLGHETTNAVEIVRGKSTDLMGYLPFGYLSVISDPPGAKIRYQGRDLGPAPYTNIVDLGSGDMELRLDHYRTYTTNVVVDLQKHVSIVAKLHPAAGPAIGDDWTNSLGMRFVPLRAANGKLLYDGRLLFCIWETRLKDFDKFAADFHFPGSEWKAPFKERDKGNYLQSESDPVVMVSWNDAKAFCQWLTDTERKNNFIESNQAYRLPADGEWSVAAGLMGEKEGTPEDREFSAPKLMFPWGSDLPPPASAGNYGPNVSFDQFEFTAPVGQFRPNVYGLFDLAGNVWEWCEDKYRPSEPQRVTRGGSWANNSLEQLSASYRRSLPPENRENTVGFRCILEITPPK